MFVTIEGIDGAGKTSAVESIEKHFDDVVTTSEPTGFYTGEFVRDLLQDPSSHPVTDFMAFMVDRMYHIDNLIEPSLRKGKLVVSDRYADSTRAYQPGPLSQAGIEDPVGFIENVMEPWNREPDLTIYLDISPETAIERTVGDEKYEDKEFLKEVRDRYYNLLDENPHRWYKIDAERDQEDVIKDVIRVIEERQ